jgi:hypothetical protein
MHACRRADPRHVRNLIGKLKIEDPQAYKRMMEGQVKMSRKEIESAMKYYESK